MAKMKHVAAASALICCIIIGTIVMFDNTSRGRPRKLVRRGPDEDRSGHQSTRLLRRLFMGLGKEKQICNIEIVKPPVDVPITQTYLASYPGAGAKRVRQFIKALTGLKVQFDYEHEPKPNAVVVQTRFPHKSGMLPPWRKHIPRAVVVIRNPLYALPALFDELYASKKTLPAKFQPDVPSFVEPQFDLGEASVPEWVSWRDRMFESQMVQYREFIRYWITNFDEDSRLVIAYEDIMNEKKGGADAIRLTEFIQEVEEVPRTPQMNEVECIWETLFTHKEGNLIHQSDAEGGQSLADDGNDDAPAATDEGSQSPAMGASYLPNEIGQLPTGIGAQSMSEPVGGARPMPMGDNNQLRRRRLDSYIIPHPSSMNASLGARPFTIQQLNMMATVLHHLIVELQDDRLNRILTRFRDENLDLVKLQDGRTFHIFEVTPPGVESHVVPNFLMGLFEPEALSTRLVTEPELSIYQDGAQVPLETTIVTQTTHMDLLALYKIFKPGFDEVFFVLSKTGTQYDSQINEEACEFNNVLCLEPQDQQFTNEDELDQVIRQLIVKFHQRFSFYFGPLSNVLSLSGENVKERLVEMNEALSNAAADQSYVNAKFGLGTSTPNSGSATQPQGTQMQPVNKLPQTGGMAQNLKLVQGSSNGRLFYCGSSGPAGNRKISLLGIYLANAFFPELRGGPPGSGGELATELTADTIKEATTSDFLVFFMHQYCEVNVLDFPGLQLHVNHPSNNNNDFMGKFNPPSDNVFVIGPHDEGPHSIHLPYGVMKWYNSVKAMKLEMSKLFVAEERPKSSRENFCLYAETVYADFRELAAHKISQIRPIYAVGSCQGNYQAGAIIEKGRPPKCQPYAYGQQPMEVMLPQNVNREVAVAKKTISNTFRFIIVIEDANIPGRCSRCELADHPHCLTNLLIF